MNPEKQRIAIAVACGWMEGNHRAHQNYYIHQKDRYVGDPMQDLNAMHEAEEVMTEMQRCDYAEHLYELARNHQEKTDKWRFVSMTAAQRAEAFLRTIGKWEDGK